MACFKNLLKISSCAILRNTHILPYSPIINSLHLCTTDITVLYRKNDLFYQGFTRRTLYTDEALGIEIFEKERNKTRQQNLADEVESFRSMMQELLDCSKKTQTLIFKPQLEKAIYLSDNQEDHLELVKEMAIKYASQNSKIRHGNFNFGPLLLHLCFVLDRPDLAMEMVSNPKLSPQFESAISYQLYMSLLYRHKLYSEILDQMDQLRTGRLIGQRYPRPCVMLALASALRMNTEEGYTRGLALAEAAMSATIMPCRFSELAGTIALHAGRPDMAIKLLRNTKWPSYYTIMNILVLAWFELGRLDQVLALLRTFAHQDSGGLHTDRCIIFKDTYDKVNDAVQQSADPALLQEFARIQRALMDRNLINKQDLLECVLLPLDMSVTTPRQERHSNRGRRREGFLQDDSGA